VTYSKRDSQVSSGMRTIERVAYILVLVPGAFVSVICLGLFIMLSIFLGLPVAAIKFILTGRSGIDWYLDDGPMDWVLMNNPLFLWEDLMARRRTDDKLNP
jgi:hypothetical protein